MARFMLAAVAFMMAPPALHRVCRRNRCRCQAAGRAGKALLDFLAAPDTVKVMKAKRLEPAG
jgi:hypothetical protein